MDDKPNNNRQVFYKNRNIKADSSRSTESKNSSVLNPIDLIAEAGKPKAYYFPNNLSSYTAGNILRFSIFKYQGGGYRAAQERPGGSDAIADLPQSDKVADIYLPEPSGGIASYKPEWETVNGSLESAYATTIATGIRNYKNNSITDDMRSAFMGAGISALVRSAAAITLGSKGVDAIKSILDVGQSTLGWYMQEYKEESFKGIGPRSFTYTFNLIPTSPTDLILISNIIQLFKWASVPGIVDIPTGGAGITFTLTNKLFESPEIIQIRHMTKVKGSSGDANNENDSLELNPWINKHLPSILTNTTIRYGSERAQYLMTYVQDRSIDSDITEEVSLGAPLMYTIDLSFKELTVLTKAAINNGY